MKRARLDAARVRLPRGAIHLRLTLSEPATITLTVGRAKGGRIVAPAADRRARRTRREHDHAEAPRG